MKRIILWLIPFVAVVGPVALYFWVIGERPQPQAPPAPSPAEQPAIRYPIEGVGPAAQQLPALDESDPAMADALAALLGTRLEKFFNLQDIIRRIVTTVDNLPRENVSLRLMPVKPVTGPLLTVNMGERLALSPENAARYRPYVRLVEAVPTEALVATYARFYPLFQRQYENLGYPDRYFNDRVVEVIDHLLEAPEADEPVLLTQPGVLYEFVDPELASLSAGQKSLVRMGADNRIKVKAKLREIRETLVSRVPKG